MLTFLALLLAAAGLLYPLFLAAAGALLLVVAALNRRQYRFYYEHGGIRFCVGSIAMHWLYYLYGMAAFGAGCAKFLAARRPARSEGSRAAEPRGNPR